MFIESPLVYLRAIEPKDINVLYEWENDLKLWLVSFTQIPFSKFILEEFVNASHQDIYTNKQLEKGHILKKEDLIYLIKNIQNNKIIIDEKINENRENIFNFGTQIKFIQSNYGQFRSNAIAMDVGVRYLSPNGLSQWSILLQNVGTQLKYFQVKEELPLNLVLGWSKKLANAPLQFSVTAERLSVWNDNYYDIDFYNAEGYQKPGSLQNIFNHLIVGSQLYIGQSFEIDLGYHFARRFELNLPNQPNSLNGISAGFSFPYKRVQFQYGTGFFQRNNYHHFTLQYALKQKDD